MINKFQNVTFLIYIYIYFRIHVPNVTAEYSQEMMYSPLVDLINICDKKAGSIVSIGGYWWIQVNKLNTYLFNIYNYI